MSSVNLGRVQGAGIFYVVSASDEYATKANLRPTNISPLVGDMLLFPTGELKEVTSVEGDNVYFSDTAATSLKGAKGDKGDKGDKGENPEGALLYMEQTLTDEQQEQARTNIDAQRANLQFKNVQVPANSFVADTTYDDYPFRAAIALSGVTDAMSPNVCFGVAQATDKNYAPVAESYNGGVYLYAKKTNDALFSIPFISLEVTE